MASKNKNKNKRRSVSAPVKAAAPTVNRVQAGQPTPAVKTMGKTFSNEFNPDYTMVKKDLKRIGTLAGIFFVVLVVLSFFLR